MSSETETKPEVSINGNSEIPAVVEAEEEEGEFVTRELIEKIVKDYNSDLELIDFTSEAGTIAGDNYASIIYSVEINAKSRKEGEEVTISIMLKTLPRNKLRQKWLNDMHVFEKEGQMYTEILKALEEYQRNKGIPENELFKPYPKCYSVYCDTKNDYLALENLRPLKYKMVNRKIGADLTHSKLILKYLGKFHAISYSMFEGDFDKILEKYPNLKDSFFKKPEDMEQQMKEYNLINFNGQVENLKKAGYVEEGEKYAKIMVDPEAYFNKLYNLTNGRVKKAVIGHGDCWCNNMLFRYAEDGTTPVEIKFVDFQLSRACSRILDIAYFLHCSIPMVLLNNRLDELLLVYLNAFKEFAIKLGVDKDDIAFDWEDFQEEYKDFQFYGVMMGMFLIPIVNTSKENVPDLEGIKEEDFKDNPEALKKYMDNFVSDESNKKCANLIKHHLYLDRF